MPKRERPLTAEQRARFKARKITAKDEAALARFLSVTAARAKKRRK